jgi:hypothetical protein
MDWCDITSAKKTDQDHVDNFFDAQDVAHKEFVPEEKTVNAEFYKEGMDRLRKRIQQVRPAVLLLRFVLVAE